MNMRCLMAMVMVLLACAGSSYAAQKPDDREALAGLTTARVIFDVRVPDLDKLNFNLKLFKETFEGMAVQGVKPKMIVVFRGPGVRLLTDSALDDEARNLLRMLKKMGVRFEACSVALRVFDVDPGKLFPEIILVANVFNSLIGYQNKGYAMIAIN